MDSSAEGAAQEKCGRLKRRDFFTASSLTRGYYLSRLRRLLRLRSWAVATQEAQEAIEWI
jgi:hypothetical protein